MPDAITLWLVYLPMVGLAMIAAGVKLVHWALRRRTVSGVLLVDASGASVQAKSSNKVAEDPYRTSARLRAPLFRRSRSLVHSAVGLVITLVGIGLVGLSLIGWREVLRQGEGEQAAAVSD